MVKMGWSKEEIRDEIEATLVDGESDFFELNQTQFVFLKTAMEQKKFDLAYEIVTNIHHSQGEDHDE
jgi:hypothetical protein